LCITEISRISSTKFDQFIVSRIVKIVAIRCHILRLKCTKFDFGWGSAPDPMLWELTALPQIPWLDLNGPTSKGREGKGREDGSGGEGRVFSLYLSIHGL